MRPSKACVIVATLLIVASTVSASESIGSTSNGCLVNSNALPLNGSGYQVMNAARQRYYGHAQMINLIQKAASYTSQNKLGYLLIGDIAAKNGGPMMNNHKSHQNGLDADVFLFMPDEPFVNDDDVTPEVTGVVDFEVNRIDRRYWSNRQYQALKFFAEDAQVDRIFVNGAIKKSLCEASGDKKWLSKIRPWREHTEHFHVRLKCPGDSLDCVAQPALPETDGCDDKMLSYWLAENINPTINEQSTEVVAVKPLRCQVQ